MSGLSHPPSHPAAVSTSDDSHLVSGYLHLAPEGSDEGLKTSIGNIIKKVLGSDEELITFDEVRFRLKEAKKMKKNRKTTEMTAQYKKTCC